MLAAATPARGHFQPRWVGHLNSRPVGPGALGPGGDEFAWWCTEAAEAFSGRAPVWRHMQDELSALVGAGVFALLAPYLEAREKAGTTLPHPAVRRKD